MIATTATDTELETYVQNIINVWNAATANQMASGRAWYHVAHDLAETIGHGDVSKGAGIIAAMSQQSAWDYNVKIATDAGNGNIHGTLGGSIRKATEIFNGADPMTVLPTDSKTWNFYRNILDPSDPDPVTIDRWAYRIATGDYSTTENTGLGNKTRYAMLAHAYRVAARRINEVPSVVQAVTWVAARDNS